jgi:hypothetical protein
VDSREYLEHKLMGRYVFYEKELFPMDNKPEQVYGIMRDTMSYWKHEYPNESDYVVKHAKFLETKVERYAHNYSIVTRVVGTMAEKDYILYRLKY